MNARSARACTSASHTPTSRAGPPVQRCTGGAAGCSRPTSPTTSTPASAAAPAPSSQPLRPCTRRRATSASSASMLAKRASRSAASPRTHTRCSHPGTALPGGGGGRRGRLTASASASIVSPWNGRSPYSASHSATQKLNWSERASTLAPACCSGDMYAGVPITAPTRVSPSSSRLCRDTSTTSDSPGSLGSSTSSSRRASPKSATCARSSPLPGSRLSSTLSGLKSRIGSIRGNFAGLRVVWPRWPSGGQRQAGGGREGGRLAPLRAFAEPPGGRALWGL